MASSRSPRPSERRNACLISGGAPSINERALKRVSLQATGLLPVIENRGSGVRVGIPNPRKSLSVIGADRRRSGPSCVCKRVPQDQTESGAIVLAAICWATCAQVRCHSQEALYLPTFSHLDYIYLIVNKLLSLSLSPSLSLSLSPCLSLSKHPPLPYHLSRVSLRN